MVLRRVWMSITEPRTIKIVYLCAYVVAVLTGLITLLDPPRSIEGVLGALTTTLWASFILAGGVVALAAVLPGWWWAERLGVWLILAGLAVYALVVLSIHLTAEGSRLTQLGVIIFASFVGIIRLALTKGFTYEPRPHRR